MYHLLKNLKEDSSVNENREHDLLCKVLKVFDKDDNTYELRIKDESQ